MTLNKEHEQSHKLASRMMNKVNQINVHVLDIWVNDKHS